MRCFLLTLTVAWPPGAQTGTDTAVLAVTAVVLSRNACKVATRNVTLDFQDIDPASEVAKTAQQTLEFVCNGSSPMATYYISADNGQWPAGGLRRMQHESDTSEFLPYSLSLSPTRGTMPKNMTQTLTISGSVAPAHFQPALGGRYADSVIITVSP